MACTIIVRDPSSTINNDDDESFEQEISDVEIESPREGNRSDDDTPSQEIIGKKMNNSSPLSPKDVHYVEGVAQRIITPVSEFSSVSKNHPENGCISPVAEEIEDCIEELSANEKDSDSFYDSDDEFRDNDDDPQSIIIDEVEEEYTFNEPSLIMENAEKKEKNLLRTPLTPSIFEKPPIDFSLPYDVNNGEICVASVWINEFSINPLVVKCSINDKIRFILNMNETASLTCEEKGLFEHIPLTPIHPIFIYQFQIEGEYHIKNEVYSFSRCTIVVSPSSSEQKQSERNHSTPPKLFGSFAAASAVTLPPKPVFHLSSSEKKKQEILSSNSYGASLGMTPSEQLKRQKLLFDYSESPIDHHEQLVQDHAVITMVDVDTEDADFVEVLNDLIRVDEDIQAPLIEETNTPLTNLSRKAKKKKKTKEKLKLKKKLLKKEEEPTQQEESKQVSSRRSVRSNSLGSLSSDSGSTVTGDYYNGYDYKKQYSLLHSEEAIPLLSKDASDKYDRMEIKMHKDIAEKSHESPVERNLENEKKDEEISYSIVKNTENKSFIIAASDFSVDIDEPLSDDEDDDDYFSQQRRHRRRPNSSKGVYVKQEDDKKPSKDLTLKVDKPITRSPLDKKPVIDESIYDENITFDSDDDDDKDDKEVNETENRKGEESLLAANPLDSKTVTGIITEELPVAPTKEKAQEIVPDVISNLKETPIKVKESKEENQSITPIDMTPPSSPPSGKKTNVLLSTLGLKTKSADEVYETERSFDRLISVDMEVLSDPLSHSVFPTLQNTHGLQNIMPSLEDDKQIQTILDFLWKSKKCFIFFVLLLFLFFFPLLLFVCCSLLGYINIQNKYVAHHYDVFPSGRAVKIYHWDDLLPSKTSFSSFNLPKASLPPNDSRLTSLPKNLSVEEENLPNTSKPLLQRRTMNSLKEENISSDSIANNTKVTKFSDNGHYSFAAAITGDIEISTSSNLKKAGKKRKKAAVVKSVGDQESKR
jgi:predicted RNA-binding protein with RPS1 domain